MNIQQIVLLAI